MQPKAIILSGGPNSVHVSDAPQLPAGFYDYVKEHNIPVLGICYGMQLLVHVRYLFIELSLLLHTYRLWTERASLHDVFEMPSALPLLCQEWVVRDQLQCLMMSANAV